MPENRKANAAYVSEACRQMQDRGQPTSGDGLPSRATDDGFSCYVSGFDGAGYIGLVQVVMATIRRRGFR